MHISIKNFLGIESLSLAFKSAINFIVGENEAGKSSFADAIKWCLTGTARGRKTHNEQAALIRDGAKAAEVTITQTSGVITRKKTLKSAPAVVGPVPKDEVMSAISCDPLTFLSFPESLRREILFRLIPGLIPNRKDIVDRLINWLPDEISEEAICDSVGDLAKLAASKGFKEAENEAITRRRIAKALIKEVGNLEDPKQKATIGDKEYRLPDFQEAQVKEGLANLQKSRDELLQRRGKTMGDMDKLPELEKELADLKANPVTPPKSGERKRLQDALEVSRPILEDLQKQVESLGTVEAPKFFPVVCPAFPGSEIPCPKAKEMASAGQKADPIKKAKVEGFLKNEQEKVDRLEGELQEAQEKQTDYEQYPQKCRDLAAEITKIQVEVARTAELDKEIAGLDARINVGQELLTEVHSFWSAKDAFDAAVAKLARAENEAILYDALAKALAPEGIPSRMIAEALQPVNDLLQVGAEHLFPGRTLTLNKELAIELSGSPYVTLSKSAKFRVGVAFQYALTKLAGARLLMLDEADILDPGNRGQLIDFLLAIKQDFDTILVFATSDHADPSPVPEIQVFWLAKGKITPVSQPMAA